MKTAPMFLMIFLTLTAIFSACGKKAMTRKYYVLEAASVQDRRIPRFTKTLPFHVEVRDFHVTRAFDQTRIAVRSASNELDYYFYHHWAVRPPVAIADLVHQVLDRTRLFRRLTREYSITCDYLVMGQILSLERVDRGEQTLARISGVLELLESKSNNTLMRYAFDQSVPMTKDRSMNRFAALISELLFQETEAFARKLADYFHVEEVHVP
ncbi:MAG TPA: hypothetical protein ENN17_04060 [bacterium]|nr:hypothetical protein [bacterium]